MKEKNDVCWWEVKKVEKGKNPTYYIRCIEANSNWMSRNLVRGFEYCPYCGKKLYTMVVK